MRLTSIKLSGFKSFVDPTTIALPSDFTVVVGPNGCGKSNIIDAVRWVMGESAAGRLRGDAMTDVIFSGSASRKPVAQASVELRFDNSEGTIGGEYAAFNEIAVRRTVSRDGTSNYFLNGSRCRRRDITELFLGTGLGPRSYAIIEQGMISQVIDARPEELRAHLEEAAGITLYKERRKETLNRIAHTRENLERLDDLRSEIGRQLEHLREQAGQAARYRELERERAHTHAHWLGVQYRQAQAQCQQLSTQLAQQQAALQAAEAEGLVLDERQQSVLAGLEAAQKQVTETQAAVYAAQAEQVRVEQSLAHASALMQRQRVEQGEADAGLRVLQEQIRGDQVDLDGLREHQQLLQLRIDAAMAERESARQALAEAEQARSGWQQQVDEATRQAHHAATALAREEARLEFVARQQGELAQRSATLQARHQGLLQEQQGEGLESLVFQADALALALEQGEAAVDQAAEDRQRAEQDLLQAEDQLRQLRGRSQVQAAQLSALQTLQGSAMGQQGAVWQGWLERHDLAQAPRLGALLSVEPGWESAVETVLGPWLDAVVVPAGRRPLLEADWEEAGRCWLVDDVPAQDRAPENTLAAKVRGPAIARDLLSCVALAAGSGASWWVDAQGRIHSAHGSALGLDDAQAGMLVREQQVRELEQALEVLDAAIATTVAQESEARHAVAAARAHEQVCTRERDGLRHRHAQLQAQLTLMQGQVEERRRSLERSDTELSDIKAQAQVLEAERVSLEATVATLQDARRDTDAAVQALDGQRQVLVESVNRTRHVQAEARERHQVLVMERETGQARLVALEQALARSQQQAQALQSRLAALDAGGVDEAGRLQALERELALIAAAAAQALARQQEAVQLLETRQQAAGEVTAALKLRQAWLEEQRESQVQLRLKLQAAELAREHVQGQAAESSLDLDAVLDGLPAEAEVQGLARALRRLDAEFAGLGAVNLAAIEEFEKAGERHAWLEGQHADLADALTTLEEAMARIDKETRSRFKETFEKINHGLQDLYPRLFGGGQAWLELVGDDLLDAGIALMARPPGKKVSSLSLLSGGEKAMTAVALVFAIFQLNPAPFCLLDEVDAPLDEANVGRLAAMLQQMSASVQFLAVSHNKATMEAADQLCGVTMREPGVSRMVSVDLAEASRLAGAA